ncbi:MAG: ornithine carbamoyltransferase [Opitutales bacterium]
MRHFLQENDFSEEEVKAIFASAFELKESRSQRPSTDLKGGSWGMMFYKQSTRTRVSFEVGIRELGGNPVILDQSSTQIGRGESIADTARVLSRFLDGLIIRTHGHEIIEEFAQSSQIPVVNALTDLLHPCQIYADCMTLLEKLSAGSNPYEGLKGKKLAFYGDTSCNMANSWILAGAMFGMEISLCGPEEFQPSQEIQTLLQKDHLSPTWSFTTDPTHAAAGAEVIYTDVWVSMGCEADSHARLMAMKPYQVNEAILEATKKESIFMHCMPAHPGEEVSQAVLDSDQAILFDQAENRLHMQKAILAALSKFNSIK